MDNRTRISRPSLVVVVACLFVGLCGSLSTTVGKFFAYDVPAIARVDIQPFRPAETGPTQLSGSPEGSASLSLEARGTSPTPVHSLVATNKVSAYDVGTYDDLVAGSARGDGLDIHHVMQDHAAQQLIPGATRGSGPAIALPQAEHRLIPNLKGEVSLTPRQVLALDAWGESHHVV